MSLIRRYPDPKRAAEACGAEVIRSLQEVLQQKATATLAISGGTSPKPMFEFFAASGFDWSRVHVFWVDERCVPHDSPDSNYKLAHDVWLKDVPARNVHPVRTDLPPEDAAAAYAEEIRPFLPLDVIHRGMGADAHTASLFPGDPLINDVISLTSVAKRAITRITLMPAVLEAAHRTVILATGADKAEPLRNVMRGNHELILYPAQLASLDPAKCTWFIDEAAAARL